MHALMTVGLPLLGALYRLSAAVFRLYSPLNGIGAVVLLLGINVPVLM